MEQQFIPFKYAKGGVMISPVFSYDDQLFSHKDTEGTYRHFHIRTLKALVTTNLCCPIVRMDITPDQVAICRQYHGIEEAYLNRMPLRFVDEPGLICMFKDDTTLLVDGNHRFVYRGDNGYPYMSFYVIPEEVWRNCLLDMPLQLSVMLVGA